MECLHSNGHIGWQSASFWCIYNSHNLYYGTKNTLWMVEWLGSRLICLPKESLES